MKAAHEAERLRHERLRRRELAGYTTPAQILARVDKVVAEGESTWRKHQEAPAGTSWFGKARYMMSTLASKLTGMGGEDRSVRPDRSSRFGRDSDRSHHGGGDNDRSHRSGGGGGAYPRNHDGSTRNGGGHAKEDRSDRSGHSGAFGSSSGRFGSGPISAIPKLPAVIAVHQLQQQQQQHQPRPGVGRQRRTSLLGVSNWGYDEATIDSANSVALLHNSSAGEEHLTAGGNSSIWATAPDPRQLAHPLISLPPIHQGAGPPHHGMRSSTSYGDVRFGEDGPSPSLVPATSELVGRRGSAMALRRLDSGVMPPRAASDQPPLARTQTWRQIVTSRRRPEEENGSLSSAPSALGIYDTH